MQEKSIEEKIKQQEAEKKSAVSKVEAAMQTLKREYEANMDKMKSDFAKAEGSFKSKEDELMMLKFSDEKTKALNNQRKEFFEKEIESLKERNEQTKKETLEYKEQIDELTNKLDEMKEENHQKKILEYEVERLKRELQAEKNKTPMVAPVAVPVQPEYLVTIGNVNDEMVSLLKAQLEASKGQIEETKRIYEDVINTLKSSLLMKPNDDKDYKEIVESNRVTSKLLYLESFHLTF